MGTELVKVSRVITPAVIVEQPTLPVLVERSGATGRFAWEEFFYAEHHNPHTQKAYQSEARRFLAWCKG
jgi:integrase/recombinase XerD